MQQWKKQRDSKVANNRLTRITTTTATTGALSHLTTDDDNDDAQSHVSRMSTMSNNVSQILASARMILQGENPTDNVVIMEEEGQEETDYSSSNKNPSMMILVPTDHRFHSSCQ